MNDENRNMENHESAEASNSICFYSNRFRLLKVIDVWFLNQQQVSLIEASNLSAYFYQTHLRNFRTYFAAG